MISTKWKKTDLTFPFTFKAALSQNQKFFDDALNWHKPSHCENARHRLLCPNSVKRKSRHRPKVMREQYSTVPRCPFQNRRIISASQIHILNANNIRLGFASQEATEDGIAKVLIGQKRQHVRLRYPFRNRLLFSARE
jgi:hypothetical protein